MRTQSPWLLGALALTCLATPAAAQRLSGAQEPVRATSAALPEARTIIDTFLRLSGRATEGWEKVESIRTAGKMEILGMGLEGTVEAFQARPGLILTLAEFEGVGEIKTGFDGKVGWMDQAMMGPMVLDGFALEQLKMQADFRAHTYDPELFEKIETVERTEFEGRECYKLRLVWKAFESEDRELADPEKSLPYREAFHYFDAENGLLAGTVQMAASPMGDIETITTATEYKEFEGILFPTKSVQKAAGMEVLITTEEVELGKVTKEVFDLPKEIRALLKEEPEGEGDGGR